MNTVSKSITQQLPPRDNRRWKEYRNEEYLISDDGFLVSLKFGKERLIKPEIDQTGYFRISLTDGDTRHRVRAHVAVLEAFDKPRPEGMVCRHLNGNPKDNRIENLQWGSVSQNARDRYKHGNQPWLRLPTKTASAIRGEWKKRQAELRKQYCAEIAQKHDIPEQYVNNLLTRKPWKRAA